MDEKKRVLLEWAETYLKSRDVIARKIIKIEKEKAPYDLFIEYKDKKLGVYIIIPGEENKVLELTKEKIKDSSILIVMYNTKQNLQFLIKNWKQITILEMISVCLVNPYVTPTEKWLINPHIHNKICDSESLNQGLQSMFSSISEVSSTEIKN